MTVAALLIATAALVVPAVAARSASSLPQQAQPPFRTTSAVLSAPRGLTAEATVAIDPTDSRRMAVADDPYRDPPRIEFSVTDDGGLHWSPAQQVLPPGAAKSYDPQLGFAADGSLVISGGASPDRTPGCQGSSSVFVAVARGTHLAFHTVATAPPGGLLDRPTLQLDPARARTWVAWTQSSGPGASCRLRPLAATTWVAKLAATFSVAGKVPLPAVALAPFGSAMGLDMAGDLGLAVAARDRTDQLIIVVYTSTRDGPWTAHVVAHARATPDTLPGLGGPVLSMPSLAGLGAGFVVGWTDVVSGTATTRLAVGSASDYLLIRAPTADAAALLPTVATGGGAVLLTEAILSPAGLRFATWRLARQRWVAEGLQPGGAAADQHELGELLGAAVAPDGAFLTAAPVGQAMASAILVSTEREGPPPAFAPASTNSSAARPSAGAAGSHPAKSRAIASPSLNVPALLLIGSAAIAGLVGWRRHRARRAVRRRRPSGSR